MLNRNLGYANHFLQVTPDLQERYVIENTMRLISDTVNVWPPLGHLLYILFIFT